MKMFRDPDPLLARRHHQEIGKTCSRDPPHRSRDPDTTSQAEALDPVVVENDEGRRPRTSMRRRREDPTNTMIPSGTWAANEARQDTMKAVEPPWSQTHHRPANTAAHPATGSFPRSARGSDPGVAEHATGVEMLETGEHPCRGRARYHTRQKSCAARTRHVADLTSAMIEPSR